MSLFSRFFRKAPALVPPPAKPRVAAEPSRPVRVEPDRAALTAREEEQLKAAIGGNDAQAIGRFVLEGSSTKIRQQAAQAIDDPAQLRQLIRDVRGKDNSAYRILTQKRDVLLAQERQQEQLRAEIAAAAAAIERHSHRPYDAVFTATLEQHQSRWNAVADSANAQTRDQVAAAIDRAREVIASHLREIATVASRELAAANAAAEEQRRRELAAKAADAAAAEQAKVLEEERQTRAAQHEAEAQFQRQIGGLIRKAQGALNDGSSGRAAGLRRAIEEKLAGASPPPLPGYLNNQLQLLDKRLAELKDWKSFSVGPKRIELMEEMESLIGADLEPQVLADRIKGLQAEWRTLSKGAGENLEAEWQRFHEASQKAYEPCKAYFENEGLRREENLQRRQALYERLANFESSHDWEHADWRTVIVALRESKQEWRRHSPVERAAAKELQGKFDTLLTGLQGRLDAEYERNLNEKKSLIERAQRLVAAEDSRKAIDDVKALQEKWRAVGLVPRDAGQRLWEEFRQHCDEVFKKRQQEYAEYNAGLEANKARAAALCEQLEATATLSGSELLEKAARAPELRADFEAIGEFPRGDARSLNSRFDRALERIEKAVERQRAADLERGWINLFDAGNGVRAYHLMLARNDDAAAQAAAKQALDEQLAAIQQWPKGGHEAIKQTLAKSAAADLAANESALRLLCVRAEIVTDSPTPAEDQQRRREYQVQRLVKNMGQGNNADDAQLDAMALEWVSVGPVEEGVYAPLLERFKRCRRT